MPIVRHFLEDGKELTSKEREEARIRLQEAARRPYVYDPDCPLLTEEQLSQFKPVNFATMEERAEAMKAAGIITDAAETVTPKTKTERADFVTA